MATIPGTECVLRGPALRNSRMLSPSKAPQSTKNGSSARKGHDARVEVSTSFFCPGGGRRSVVERAAPLYLRGVFRLRPLVPQRQWHMFARIAATHAAGFGAAARGRSSSACSLTYMPEEQWIRHDTSSRQEVGDLLPHGRAIVNSHDKKSVFVVPGHSLRQR